MVDFENKEIKDHAVRLFPTAHIKSSKEAEVRATASLLAMIQAVSEFGRTIVRVADGPAGKLSCYTEVNFKVEGSEGFENIRPDGIIRAVRGRTDWKAIVEVKVGNAPLEQDQFDRYHKMAKDEGFDAVITISNQAALANGLPPLSVDRRRCRKVPVFQFSWDRLVSIARMLSRKKEIQDLDQSWMLDEWIRYVADPDSKIIEPPDLGAHWKDILKAARVEILDEKSRMLEDVAKHWAGFLRKTALQLSAKLGVGVEPRVTRTEEKDPNTRIKNILDDALKNNRLSGALKIPHTAGDLSIVLDLKTRCAQFGVVIDPPIEGRQKTRVTWLTRQLKGLSEAPNDMAVVIKWAGKRMFSRATMRDLRTDESPLMRDTDGNLISKDIFPGEFRLEWTPALETGRSSTKVLEGISNNLERFYQQVVQKLDRYVPPTPKLSAEVTPLPSSEMSEEERTQTPVTEHGDKQNTPATSTKQSEASAPENTIGPNPK